MPDVSIIQSLTRLPIGLLTPALDANGPYGAGNHILSTWKDGATVRNVSDTFGVVVQINGAIAVHLGRVNGFDDGGTVNLDEYELRIVQVTQLFQANTGVWLPMQVNDLHFLPQVLRWVEDLPGRIGLFVSPTWSVDLYYLKTI